MLSLVKHKFFFLSFYAMPARVLVYDAFLCSKILNKCFETAVECYVRVPLVCYYYETHTSVIYRPTLPSYDQTRYVIKQRGEWHAG